MSAPWKLWEILGIQKSYGGDKGIRINRLAPTASVIHLPLKTKGEGIGVITAGIAYETKNPLNFVNNFSEVRAKLTTGMNEELAKGDYEEALAPAADIKLNLEKINTHVKFADTIVKSMPQHAPTGGPRGNRRKPRNDLHHKVAHGVNTGSHRELRIFAAEGKWPQPPKSVSLPS